jgi:hypothetical protein
LTCAGASIQGGKRVRHENFYTVSCPDPDVIAQEIVEDLEAALEQFREIVGDLGSRGAAEGAEE